MADPEKKTEEKEPAPPQAPAAAEEHPTSAPAQEPAPAQDPAPAKEPAPVTHEIAKAFENETAAKKASLKKVITHRAFLGYHFYWN